MAIVRYLYRIFSLINCYKEYNRTLDYKWTTNLQKEPNHFVVDFSKGFRSHTTNHVPPAYGSHVHSETLGSVCSSETIGYYANDDHCRMSRSLECASYNVQLPKSFSSDSLIVASTYVTRCSLFCDLVALWDWYNTQNDYVNQFKGIRHIC